MEILFELVNLFTLNLHKLKLNLMVEELQNSLIYNKSQFLKEIKENIQLIKFNNRKFIIKGKRDKERNILEKLRFTNEKRIYMALENASLTTLKFPAYRLEPNTGHLILDYIKKSENSVVSTEDYVSSYFELQRIKPAKRRILDIYNQTFRGFFYRTFIVSLITLPKKVNVNVAIRSILLAFFLNLKQKNLTRKYWIHGDLTGRNYFYDQNQALYFIDFENMFYTRKWFLAEIIGKSFIYDYQNDTLNFSVDAIQKYIDKLHEEPDHENFCMFKQVRFGLLQYSILQIAQTKIKGKQKTYLNLLLTTLNKKSFQKWYDKHIENQVLGHNNLNDLIS